MNTGSLLLSVSEAKKQLGVSSQSIRRFISEGQLIGEKTDTGRWAVESESVRQLLARRKSQHDAKPHATPQAINVATKAVNRAINNTSKADISTFQSSIKTVIDEKTNANWPTAQEVIKIFHQNMFDFLRPEKFKVRLVTDWSCFTHFVYMEENSVGSLYNFDEVSIQILLDENQTYEHLKNLPIDVWKFAFDMYGRNTSCSDAEVWKHITVYYDEIIACRSEPVRTEVIVLT